MSAYVVEKHHIVYLVQSARSRALNHGSDFTWWHNGERHAINDNDDEPALRIANILYRENVKSVQYRYNEGEKEDNLPGVIGETYWINSHEIQWLWHSHNPVQVIKACNCYEYQSCEHEGWETSEAKAFIDRLVDREARRVPGYDSAEWGAPEPAKELIRLL